VADLPPTETSADPASNGVAPRDVADLLSRTTPTGLAPLDLGQLGRRARTRRRRHHAVLVAGVLVVVAMLAAVTTRLTGDEDAGQVHASDPFQEPVGAWSQIADPPFSPRANAFAGTLRDGRVVVWGGNEEVGVETARDGAIYDPAADEWTTIPEAPLPALQATTRVSLAGNRLAVVGVAVDDGTIVAAVYDITQGTWQAAPARDDTVMDNPPLDIAWDGEVLVVVRGDEEPPPETSMMRWELGAAAWEPEDPPIPTRDWIVAVAFDGTHLALWGAEPTRAAGAFLYDVRTGEWQQLPDPPLPRRRGPEAVWHEGRLLIGGGVHPETRHGMSDVASYDPATDSWEVLDDVPDGHALGHVPWMPNDTYVEGRPPFVVNLTGTNLRFLGPDGWELAPQPGLLQVGNLVAATQDTRTGEPFEVDIRVEAGRWLRAMEPPFEDRVEATVVATGDRIIVLGGWMRHPPTRPDGGAPEVPLGDAWSLDLSG
jgi:hypothetical protein